MGDETTCECGHSSYVHARTDHRDNTFTYPCRQVLPLDPSDGRLRAEPPPCPCTDYQSPRTRVVAHVEGEWPRKKTT